MFAEGMAQEETRMAGVRYREAVKDAPFLRIPDVCGILAIGVSDVTVDMIAVYKKMVSRRILFWRRKCSRRNPTSLGSGLCRLAEGTKHGHHDLESCFGHVSVTFEHHSHHDHHLQSDLPVSRSDGSRLLHDARTRNAKHMKVARATQP